MSEYTVGLALGSVLVVLFDVYAYYRYRYSEDVLDNAQRTRKRTEAARRFEEDRAKTGEEVSQGISSIEFQRGFGEVSGFSQLETIPVSFDELKRASGVSGAEQEKEMIKLRDEVAILNERLSSLKKQSDKKPEEETDAREVESFGEETYRSADYGVENVSFAERNEREEKRAKEREEFEAELKEREKEPEFESAASIGEREQTAGGLGESAFVEETPKSELENFEQFEPSESASTSLAQDLTAEEEPEEEEFETAPKRGAKKKTSKAGKAKKAPRKKR
ncbi:hypothetical protein H0N96_00380 [Candidatus Micrarchaeota archaeon]|nr:hypothetical protein [Candidatus Micrarchaeota archaeon]